uniref:Uncharacterized protein n=1 Tax=Sphaerodactylus townsendi TaxID=933632 RepID=A0ACB8G0G9_9SAUR
MNWERFRYYYIAFKAHETPVASKDSCVAILQKVKLDKWLLGKTKVFLKYYHVEQLNLCLREVIGRVVVMQAYTKGWLGARRYKKLKQKRANSAVAIQSAWRGYDARRKFKDIKTRRVGAAIHIQAGCIQTSGERALSEPGPADSTCQDAYYLRDFSQWGSKNVFGPQENAWNPTENKDPKE